MSGTVWRSIIEKGHSNAFRATCIDLCLHGCMGVHQVSPCGSHRCFMVHVAAAHPCQVPGFARQRLTARFGSCQHTRLAEVVLERACYVSSSLAQAKRNIRAAAVHMQLSTYNGAARCSTRHASARKKQPCIRTCILKKKRTDGHACEKETGAHDNTQSIGLHAAYLRGAKGEKRDEMYRSFCTRVKLGSDARFLETFALSA